MQDDGYLSYYTSVTLLTNLLFLQGKSVRSDYTVQTFVDSLGINLGWRWGRGGDIIVDYRSAPITNC